MSDTSHPAREVESLLARVRDGDSQAIDALLERYREPLTRMIELRLDSALRGRVDAADIVQETFLEATERMTDYLTRNPMPFDLWLRKTARERLIMERRRHIKAAARSVTREIPLPEQSSLQLAERIFALELSPVRHVSRKERAFIIRRAVAQLPEHEREVVIMRWIEGLDYAAISAVLGIEQAAARKRHARALIRLHKALTCEDLSSVY
jgi:RNA polymerase sigma-70 factor (ECF subfamily)